MGPGTVAYQPTSSPPASGSDLSRFGQAILDFKARYELLNSIPYGAAIARTGDNALMLEFGETLASMERMKNRIEAVEGAWQRAREFVGLGALPLIPLAVVAGLTVAIIAAIRTMDAFFRRAGIQQIQRENPGIPYTQAAAMYQSTLPQSTVARTFDVAKLALWGGIAFIGWQALKTFKGR